MNESNQQVKKKRIFWYERDMRKCLCNFGTDAELCDLSCHAHMEVYSALPSKRKKDWRVTVVTFEKSFHFQNLTPYKLCHSFLNSKFKHSQRLSNGNAKPNSC